MSITSIPLSSLIPSPVNVRKIGGTSIDDLAASIEAHGLIQTLTVRAAEKDKFEVVAGGRRLAALNRLLKEKRSANGVKVSKAFPVDCRVLDGEDAVEISLAENAIRQGMHPADQFDAFKALADGGMSAADIAARFGLSEKVVRQRLKLASLSPVLLAAFRKDEMAIEQAMAFTISDDHARQEEVWKAAKKNKGYYDSLPHGIRNALTGQAIRASSGLAKAIGEEAYVAAGGAVSRDLFSTDDEAFWTNGELVERLAQEKLAEVAVQVKAEGWGEVITHVGYFNEHAEDCRRVQREGRPMTLAEAAKRDRLLEEQNALVDDGSEEATAQYDALDAEINAIEEAAENDWSAVEGKEQMLAVVVLNRGSGEIEVLRGYVRNSADAQAEVFDRPGKSAASTVQPKEKPDFSASLLTDLSSERTMAMRAAMADSPTVALDTLLWTLAMREFNHGTSDQFVAQVRLDVHFQAERALAETPAGIEMSKARERWAEHLPGEAGALWEWITSAAQLTKLDLLAYLVATSLNAVQMAGSPAKRHSDLIHMALDLDMADWWKPTGDNYLGRVPRDKVLEALIDAGETPDNMVAFRAMKKAPLIEKAEKALAETRWLPKPLRAPEPEVRTVANENADREEAA